jgi:hypothetical protein
MFIASLGTKWRPVDHAIPLNNQPMFVQASSQLDDSILGYSYTYICLGIIKQTFLRKRVKSKFLATSIL